MGQGPALHLARTFVFSFDVFGWSGCEVRKSFGVLFRCVSTWSFTPCDVVREFMICTAGSMHRGGGVIRDVFAALTSETRTSETFISILQPVIVKPKVAILRKTSSCFSCVSVGERHQLQTATIDLFFVGRGRGGRGCIPPGPPHSPLPLPSALSPSPSPHDPLN